MGEWMYSSTFLTVALFGGEWSASCPGCFIPGERAPGTHLIGGWVGPRTHLDDLEKRKISSLPGLELGPLGCPACSQSLYRLHYPSSYRIRQHQFNACTHFFQAPSANQRTATVKWAQALQASPHISPKLHIALSLLNLCTK
jgi:hypothetical protein